jgi:hypothetical protein
MGEVSPQGGIDSRSSTSEIREAFERLGLRLDVNEVGPGMWEARAVASTTGGTSGISGRGGSEREAAAAAWRSHVRSAGGVGAS